MNLDAFVSKVGDQLTSVVRKQITENITLVTGVEKEIQNISTNLRKIQEVLDDAEAKKAKDSNIKEWLEKLEDFSYEIEDVVDEWNTEILKNQAKADELVEKVWCCFLSYVLCFNLLKTRHHIGVKIKKLNEKLELIVKEKDKFNFLPSVKVKSKEWTRAESTGFIDESGILGRDGAKSELIGKLCTSKRRNPVSIIEITGSRGIENRTLAQLAFDNVQVKAKFGKMIWVCVGESFDVLKIANQILKNLNSDSKDESNLQTALDNIKTSILNTKVLLVLDDVWMVNEGGWESLISCLSHVASGSKIVVTTRSNDVAKTLGATNEVVMKLLNDGDCWRVTQKMALFGKRAGSTWFTDESVIFGPEEAKNNIISKLCAPTQDLIPIIKIIGSGGIGKTSLAQLAFNDDEVIAEFRKRIWICVGEIFDGLKIANQINKILDENYKDKSNLQTALDELKTSISEKKVLFIFDDVWMVNEDDWEKLKRCISHVASGNKIVVTSRSDDVAKTLGATDEVSVNILTDDECWHVIRKCALFGKSETIGAQLETIGKEIAKKCKGLPLAAKALGSLLRFRETEKEWEEVQNSELWELEGVVCNVFPHLQLSYNDIPSAMKRCFVYCSILPKDAEIDVGYLIRMWIGQGYLKPKKRRDTLEQVGLECFKGLAARAFFQEVREKYTGIFSCKMHYIVHDFAQYLAKEECVTIADAMDAEFSKNARHLAITCKHVNDSDVTSFLLSVHQTGMTRSIYIRTMGINERMVRLFCHLKRLRILRISDKEVKQLPKEVGNLSHLRLLDVAGTKIVELPDKICDLYNLQALYCGVFIRKLPPKIGRLMNLRTLHLGTPSTEIPQSIERLTRLQHLTCYGVGTNSNKLSYLRNLNQLTGRMIITFKKDMSGDIDVEEAKMAELEKKKIDCLVLSLSLKHASKEFIEAFKPQEDLSELVFSGYMGHQLPNWISKLSSLRHLQLLLCIKLKSFPLLWKFPFLETLRITQAPLTRLSIHDFFGVNGTADQNCTSFPNLKTLELNCWGDLEEWEDIGCVEAIIMPRLEQLQVNYANVLEVLPYNLLSKATNLHSIEFNEIKYGPITSLKSTEAPFVSRPLPLRPRTTYPTKWDQLISYTPLYARRYQQIIRHKQKLELLGRNVRLPPTLATRVFGNLSRIILEDNNLVDYSLGIRSTFDPDYMSFRRLKPEAEEFEQGYYKTVLECVAPVDKRQDDTQGRLAQIPENNIEQGVVQSVQTIERDISESEQLQRKVVEKVDNLKSYQFNLAMYKLNKQMPTKLNMRRTTYQSRESIDFDEYDADYNDEVGVEPSAEAAPEVVVCAEERQPDHEEIPLVEKMSVHVEEIPFMAKRTVIAEDRITLVGREDRSERDKWRVSAAQSPNGNLVPKKKQKAPEEDGSVYVVPMPFDPSIDFAYNTSKYSMLSSWIEKNENRSKEIGLVPIIQQYDAISAYDLREICSKGWLSNEDIDAILQLFNLQGERYPGMFPSTRWTCLGSLYNVAVQSGYKMFIENRQMEESKATSRKVSWQDIDMDLYKFVMGTNKSWESKFWYKCDYVYGIENIAEVHWAAYSYDFKNRVVHVYDSVLNVLKNKRMEVFEKHAAIAPSLFNLHFDRNEDMLDPDIPFDIKIVNVPQQPNSFDCGVYACMFVQGLAMQDDFSKLLAERFPDYRKKLAINLIKWTGTSIGKFSFHELQIKRTTT